MTPTLALQLYLFAGLLYGLVSVAITEAKRPTGPTCVPLRRMARVYLAALAIGALAWPVALVMDLRGRR